MLRHTAASLAIASGADVKVLPTMLGHKSATLLLDLSRCYWICTATRSATGSTSSRTPWNWSERAAVSRDAGLVRDARVEERRKGLAELASDEAVYRSPDGIRIRATA